MNSIALIPRIQPLKYLQGYGADTLTQVTQVTQLMAGQGLGEWLLKRYPSGHGMRTDKALFEYVQNLKQDYLRGAEPLKKGR
jgi:hypothetical protein